MFSAKACSTLLATKFLKSSCRARKSVWELTSMITARLLSSATLTAIEPSAAMLPAFLAALMAPAARMSSMAFSMSPPAAVSAFLQSIMPWPVRSRSSLTRAAVISAMFANPLDSLSTSPFARAINSEVAKRGHSPLLVHRVSTRRTTRSALSSLRGGFFDELLGTAGAVLAATQHGVGHGAQIELHGTDCIIVTGDDVVDAFRAAVGIDDADNRDAQLVGFADGDALVVDVDDEHGVRQTAHILDTTQAALELLEVTGAHQRFFLGQLVESTVLGLGFQLAQALDRRTDGLVVGQHAAQPAMIDVRRAATCCFFANDLASGALGADEQDLVLARSQLFNELQRVVEHRQGFFAVDDMDLVARAENVLVHFRVPVTGLVAEVHTGLQHVAH